MEPAPVDNPADHLAHVIRRPGVGWHHVVQAGRVLGRLLHGLLLQRRADQALERRDDAPHDDERVGVVVGEMVGDPASAGVHVTTAEVFGGDYLARSRFY